MEWIGNVFGVMIIFAVIPGLVVGLPAFAGWMMGRWILKRGCALRQKEFVAPAWFAWLYFPLMVLALALSQAPALILDPLDPLRNADPLLLSAAIVTASLTSGLVPTLLIGYWYNFIRKDGRGERDDRHLPAT